MLALLTLQAAARGETPLPPGFGRVLVQIQPPAAEIYVRGRLVGTGPSSILLPVGRHRLTFRLPGFHETAREIQVQPRAVTELRVTLFAVGKPTRSGRRTLAWVLGGVSLASAVAGILTGRSAKSSEEEIQSGTRAGTLRWDRYHSLSSSARTQALLANVSFGIAGAAAIAAIVLFVTGGDPAPPRRAWHVLPDRGGGLISVEF
jgi:hypothetical protein